MRQSFYLRQRKSDGLFSDFDTSEYFCEQKTMGKEPQPDHAFEMQRAVKRYYKPYFQDKLLCHIDGDALQQFIIFRAT